MDLERRGKLKLLLVYEAYLVNRLHQEFHEKPEDLKVVHNEINEWYREESDKLKIQSKMEDLIDSERVRIYHHELHQKHILKSSILQLDAPNENCRGHAECADFLERSVADILSGSPELNGKSQDILLGEVERVFSPQDNELLLKKPTKGELHNNLKESNLHAAPGSDGLTSSLPFVL